MRPGLPIRLADKDAESCNSNHRERIDEIQRKPFVDATIVKAVALADGVATPVAHGLGRLPIWVGPSAVRGAVTTGRIEELRDAVHDRKLQVVLKASGWGGTIFVDVAVL